MRLMLAMLLWCFAAMASAAPLLSYFEDGQHLRPLDAIDMAAALHLGEVMQYRARVADEQLQYQFTLVDPGTRLQHKLVLDGRQGQVLQRSASPLAKEAPVLALALLLRERRQTLSALARPLLAQHPGYLQQALLDQDLGISYLELKILDEHGSYNLAFDIEHQRQLPLLKWD
ncbi:hypothetical protein [Shewanella sp. YIC-542]|uniref:hypothetical protein n=1 Tax=Shewanella mytili TaxID=3377111 RepID=UPI00398E4300